MARARAWTHDEDVALLKARIYSVTWEMIALDNRRTVASCKQRLQELRLSKAHARLVGQIPVRRTATPARAAVKSVVPTSEIMESNARKLLRYAREASYVTADVTATFFGDPLPGDSALDRKRELVS